MKLDRGLETQAFFQALAGLRQGDKVRINDRSHAMTVSDVISYDQEKLFRPNALNGKRIILHGNGTSYGINIEYESSPYGKRWRNEATMTWPTGSEQVHAIEIV